MKVAHFSCGPAVNESELKAFERLKTGLISLQGDGEWILLTNLRYSAAHHFQSDEIDIVAIGPSGVRVIEVKHWSAGWAQRHADIVEREADRVTSKAAKIGTTLRKSEPAVGHVDGAILLTRQPSKVRQLAGQPIRGAAVYTLKNWKEAVGAGGQSLLRPNQVMTLARTLEPKSAVAVDGSLSRLGNYVKLDLQTPTTERFHRIYKGVHLTRKDRVILHLYDYSADSTTNAENRARREHEALHRLQLFDWAPRILDSFQAAPGYAGEMSFFTVVDPAAPTLDERRSDQSWTRDARLVYARNVVRAVRDLHLSLSSDRPFVHRNLTPDSLLVKHDNSPILTGFDLSRIPAEETVASASLPLGAWEAAVAPEIHEQGLVAADQRSDVYSLSVCLKRLLWGYDQDLNVSLVEALEKGTTADPTDRIALVDLETAFSAQLGESVPEPPPPPVRFWTEDQMVTFQQRNYRVVTRLGSGGIGTTFKVVEIDRATGEDRGTYVAKVVHDPDVGNTTVGAYSLARSHLGRHQALSTIFEVAPKWSENKFAALMTWIEGVSLRDYMEVFSLLAEDQGEDSDLELALRWIRSMCEALDVLHRNGLVHGDVSPGNMIVSGNHLVLTDYDLVAKIGSPRHTPGTMIYSSPIVEGDRTASASNDIYALAASFFHILFDRTPFLYNGILAKDRGLNWKGIDRPQYGTVADFFDRATHTDPKERFSSVQTALQVLVPSDDTSEEPEQRREEKVEWLESLLQSYPGSLWGNRETRGLDSDFAQKTYVETDLEKTIYDEIRDRRLQLVVLCGNAGDGKTALLQHLATDFGIDKHKSSERVLENTTADGLVIRMNLDGSASWQGRSADELLDEFLEPFQSGRSSANIAHLLAINDGRLLEWIEGVEERRTGETPLTEELFRCLEAANDTSPKNNAVRSSASHIRFISLNQRSLVGGIKTDTSDINADFISRLLDLLYGGDKAEDIWKPCQTCSAQDRCEVFRTNRVFGPSVLARGMSTEIRTHARRQLIDALQAVHLRGETHLTVRELRAALVYILFGLHSCENYHRAGQDDTDDVSPQLPYWERAFDAKSPNRQGEVLQELVCFDPALEAHPKIDRRLLETSGVDSVKRIGQYTMRPLESCRRRAYFEWTPAKIAKLTGSPYELDLTRGRHFRQFRDLLVNKESRQDLCKRLCKGISRLEILPPQALERADSVPLRITPRTPTDTEFWVEKSFDAFRLEPELPPPIQGVEQLHRSVRLTYRFRDGHEEQLHLGADLFHLLLELGDGYQLGDVASDDTFAHLSIFVQRLIREDDRTLMAWNPMREQSVYKISTATEEVGTNQQIIIRSLEAQAQR